MNASSLSPEERPTSDMTPEGTDTNMTEANRLDVDTCPATFLPNVVKPAINLSQLLDFGLNTAHKLQWKLNE